MPDRGLPLPLEIVSNDEALAGMFPDGPPTDNDSPLAAAWLWRVALLNLPSERAALEHLSVNPPTRATTHGR